MKRYLVNLLVVATLLMGVVLSFSPVYATSQLVGRADVAADSFHLANNCFVTRYTATSTGTMTEMQVRVKATTAGNVILGIYADNGTGTGPTGGPLATTASTAVGSAAERSITAALTSSVTVYSGTVYWLAFNSDVQIVGSKTEAGYYSYKALAYGALPNPIGAGWTAPGTTLQIIISGYGTVADPPTITTGVMTGNANSWAILNETLTGLGTPATCPQIGFDYGLTTAYGSSVTSNATVSYSLGSYSQTLTGLSPSTSYHYRAKAYNGLWWGYGADSIFSTTGSPQIEYYFQTAADNQSNIYGINWACQTFTTDNTTARTVTSVNLLIDRVGSPGYLTVSIRDTAGGVPTGVDLCSGVILTDNISTTASWYQVPMTVEKSLNINTVYAVVVRALSGDGSNYIQWKMVNAGGFAGGNKGLSGNSGVAWAQETRDFNFEIWGNACVRIQDVKVFQGYKSAGDWLIVCRYVNVFPPYYPNEDIKRYFAIQLIDSVGTVLSSNALSEWGNRVASIYLSAAQVTSLDWNGAYKIRIQGLFTGSPYTEYSLVAGDWLGTDLTYLDSWSISSANVMAAYDTALTGSTKTYVSNIATRGAVLSSSGGDLLVAGIAGLQTVRPSLFQIYTVPTTHTPGTGTATMANAARAGTATAIGPDAVTAFNRVGIDALGGLPYNYVIAILAVVLCFGLAAATFPFGHTTAANVLCLGILFAFGFFGFDWIWIGMVYLVSVFLLAKKLWIDTGI